MRVECCVCGKHLGDKPDCKGMEGKISHGYCELHFKEFMEKIKKSKEVKDE